MRLEKARKSSDLRQEKNPVLLQNASAFFDQSNLIRDETGEELVRVLRFVESHQR
jgi:hypothetical protein